MTWQAWAFLALLLAQTWQSRSWRRLAKDNHQFAQDVIREWGEFMDRTQEAVDELDREASAHLS